MKYVYIGIPSRTKGFWDMYTHLLLACNVAAQKQILCTIDPHVGSSLICRARQNITNKFLYENPKAEYFLQLDDDVALPPNAIVDMVEAIDGSCDVNVIGGAYALKTTKGQVALRMLGNKKYSVDGFDGGLLEVKYLSTGCFMQNREVVQAAWDHYKKDRSYIDNKDRKQRVALYTPFIYDDEYLSEDWAYCQRLIDMGEKMWLHTAVKCGHWGLAQYGVK